MELKMDVSPAKVLKSEDGKKIFYAYKARESAPILRAIRSVSRFRNEYETEGRLTPVKIKAEEIVLIGHYETKNVPVMWSPPISEEKIEEIKQAAPVTQVEITLPKRATSIGGRVAITCGGAASLVPFAASVDLVALLSQAMKHTTNIVDMCSLIVGAAVGTIVSGMLLSKLSNNISKKRNEFFQHVADAFETAIKAVEEASARTF